MSRCITRSACRWPGFDPEKYRARIVDRIPRRGGRPAATAYEKKIQDRAAELLGLLNQARMMRSSRGCASIRAFPTDA